MWTQVKERTGWKPRFGPADIKDLTEYLRSGKQITTIEQRQVRFPLKNRLAMGSNLGFNVSLLLFLPLLISSIWITGLWWKTLPLLYVLSLLSTSLVFWLPGKIGVQKGLSLGMIAAAVFIAAATLHGDIDAWPLTVWTGWILLVSAYVGYDAVSWSPLWRQDNKELILGRRTTQVEIIADKCINCDLCAIVCPVNVFEPNPETRKYEVARLRDCVACGACIENCPTEAILNNFRGASCACPTCTIINGVGALTKKTEG